MTTYTLTVREYELDSFGHVNNAVYLNYTEAAKWDFFRKTGIMGEIKESGIFPVILENNVRYISELRIGDSVNITTKWKCSGKILHFSHVLLNTTKGTVSARVKGKLIFADNQRVLYDIPEYMKEYMEAHKDEN